jgi:hypothetical protein
MILIFSFFGFLDSRLPLAMSLSLIGGYASPKRIQFRLHCSVMFRSAYRFVNFGSYFIFTDLMKAYREFRCLLRVHRQWLQAVIAEFYSPDAMIASMRLNQQNRLIGQYVILQQRVQCNHQVGRHYLRSSVIDTKAANSITWQQISDRHAGAVSSLDE